MLEDRIRAAQARMTALLEEAGPAVSTPIPHMDWTVADTAAHMITGAREYVGYFRGTPSPVADITDTGAANQSHMAEYLPRDAPSLSRDLSAAVDRLVEAYHEGDPDRLLTWHAGHKVSAFHMGQLLLGELVVHGWDMAVALGKPWPIDPADAAAILEGGLYVAPALVDPDAAKGMNGVVEIRLRRGAGRHALRWKDGSLTVGVPEGKADCIVSADPVAMLMSSYGRGSKWKPILTGKVVSYGRKPMLALKMLSALRNP